MDWSIFNSFGFGLVYGVWIMSILIVWASREASIWRGIVKGPFSILYRGQDVRLADEGETILIMVEKKRDRTAVVVLIAIASVLWPLTLAFVVLRWLLSLPVKLYRKAGGGGDYYDG